MSKPALIRIQSDILPSGRRIWMATKNGVLLGEFRSGQDAIESVHKELCAHAAQRKRERNAAIAKTAMNILSRIAANQLNKK